MNEEFPHYIACGGLETMQRLADGGVTGLNTKTHKWQVISKTAKYLVVKTGEVTSEEYGVQAIGELWSNEDLKAMKKQARWFCARESLLTKPASRAKMGA